MGDIVERLRLLVPSDSSGAAFDAVNEITRLRNELHITQEWSARVIAGHEQDMTEITALRAEVERLRAVLEVMSMMGGYTKLHPDETAPGVEQNTYSWGVSDGYKEMAEMARAALEEKQ